MHMASPRLYGLAAAALAAVFAVSTAAAAESDAVDSPVSVVGDRNGVGAAEGFWGPRTASVDWCEPNYVVLYYVAEFWNTLSSVPILLGGLYGMYCVRKYHQETRFFMLHFCIAVVGFGSMAFHGTLLYWGQMLDEMPMVYTTAAYFYAILEADSLKVRRPWLVWAMILYCIGFSIAYFLFPHLFFFFLGTYAIGVVIFIVLGYAAYQRAKGSNHQKLFALAVVLYIGTFLVFWIPENLWCPVLRPYNFHAWFHLGGATGPYLATVFLTAQRMRDLRRKGRVEYQYGILPYAKPL